MRPKQELDITSNSTVYRRRWKQLRASCSYCKWHRVENASRHPKHPVERELLQRLGDPNVDWEDPAMVKVAGERPTENSLKKSGSLPEPVKLEGNSPSTSEIALGDWEDM